MNKLRLSYTLCSLWKRGVKEDVLNYYFKLADLSTYAIEEGKAIDNMVSDCVIEKKRLPYDLGGDKLKNPKTQLKLEASLNKAFDLVGVLDIYDEPSIIEIKSGASMDSADYLNTWQAPIYLLLASLNGLKVDRAWVIHIDQSKRKHDRSLIWNSDSLLERTKEYLYTVGNEIFAFFKQEGLI